MAATAAPATAAEPGIGADASASLKALDERGNVRALADVELDMIRLAIDHYHGQMSEVARRLGIGRSTLYRKLKEYGIDPGDRDDPDRAGVRDSLAPARVVVGFDLNRRFTKNAVGSLLAGLSPWCYRISASISR